MEITVFSHQLQGLAVILAGFFYFTSVIPLSVQYCTYSGYIDRFLVMSLSLCEKLKHRTVLNFFTGVSLLHCKLGEANTVCIWKLHPAKRAQGPRTCVSQQSVCGVFKSLGFDDRCVFHNSIFDFSKYHLYIEIMKFFKLSCQGRITKT